MYSSAIEVLKGEYPSRTKMKYDYCMIVQGRLEVLVIEHDSCYDVWNMHPLRKSWQKVYTLKHCNPEEQCVQSIQSLKRLFEKE